MISTRALGSNNTEQNTYYPRLLGTRGAIACEHYLAADAGADILKAGGNAVDAAVAATLVEGLVNPHMHTIGGECPMLICMAGSDQVISVNGNTVAPELATVAAYKERGFTDMPDEGILAAGVPAAFAALLTALERFGRLPFAEVVAPVLSLARNGFPLHHGLRAQPKFSLSGLQDKFLQQWPGSAELYLVDGQDVPDEGALMRNPAWVDVFENLSNIEKQTSGSRSDQLKTVLEGFYRGDVATEIDRYSQQHDGLLRRSDLEQFQTRIEQPVSLNFQDITLFKCGFWNQGPVVLQILAILKQFDLKAMGHNSADYLHIVVEATKLAFADREQYYADPSQVEVPGVGLLSEDYARQRAQLILLKNCWITFDFSSLSLLSS